MNTKSILKVGLIGLSIMLVTQDQYYAESIKSQLRSVHAHGDCHGRDLHITNLGWIGHVGLESYNDSIYEMLTQETTAWESGLPSNLWLSTLKSFQQSTVYWGNRWDSIYWAEANRWYLDVLELNMQFCDKVGCDYSYVAVYRDPVILSESNNKTYYKGLYRCDTFVYRMYEIIGKQFNLTFVWPANVFNSFTDNSDYSFFDNNLENNLMISNDHFDYILKMLNNTDYKNNYKNVISVIKNETEQQIIREIALYLIRVIHSKQTNDDELIKSEIRKMLTIPNCADELVKIDIGSIYSEKELENIFDENCQYLSDTGKMSLANLFVNKSILNEKPFDHNSAIGQYICNNITEKDIQLRKAHVTAGWYRLTNDFSFSNGFKNELRDIIIKNKSYSAQNPKIEDDFKVLDELLSDPDNNKKHHKGNFKITLTTCPPIK